MTDPSSENGHLYSGGSLSRSRFGWTVHLTLADSQDSECDEHHWRPTLASASRCLERLMGAQIDWSGGSDDG